MKQARTLWTRQRPEVWEELKSSGIYRLKKNISKKKTDPSRIIIWNCTDGIRRPPKSILRSLQAVSIPSGCRWRGVHAAASGEYCDPEARDPEGQYLICNMKGWITGVNYWYVPLDQEDDKKHKEELKRYGIASEDELVTGRKGEFIQC